MVQFWSGSPFALNITVVVATGFFLLFVIYFVCTSLKGKAAGGSVGLAQLDSATNIDGFDPENDHNSDRPLGVLILPDPADGTKRVQAGNLSLLLRLPHVTPEVVQRLGHLPYIDLFRAT
jgi:hypothetical protein